MAYEIRKPDYTPPPKTKAKKNAGYLAFLHKLPCVITGRTPVEAAHVSFAAIEYGHYGRGKSSKAPDRWALPLHASQHREGKYSQHSNNERDWWVGHGIDPHKLALVIHGLWVDMGDDAIPYAAAIIKQTRDQAKPAT